LPDLFYSYFLTCSVLTLSFVFLCLFVAKNLLWLSRLRCLRGLRVHLRTTLLHLRPQVVDFRVRIHNRGFQTRPAGLRKFQLRLHSSSFTLELLPTRISRHFRTSASITLGGGLDVLRPQRIIELLDSRFEISNLALDIHQLPANLLRPLFSTSQSLHIELVAIVLLHLRQLVIQPVDLVCKVFNRRRLRIVFISRRSRSSDLRLPALQRF